MPQLVLIVVTGILCLLPSQQTWADDLKITHPKGFNLEQIKPKPGLRVSLEYKKDTNITGKALYAKNAKAYLHKEALTKLNKAIYLLGLKGYGITILDAWRPPTACALLWNKALQIGLKEYYCPPDLSGHTRGVAVDVTLHKLNHPDPYNKISMPSEFDEINPKLPATPESLQNARTLKEAMNQAGFIKHPKEWWHFSLPNEKSFPIIEKKEKKRRIKDNK